MEHAILLVLAGRRCKNSPFCKLVSNFVRDVDKISKIFRRSSMRNQKLHRTTKSFLNGTDIVGADPRKTRCLRQKRDNFSDFYNLGLDLVYCTYQLRPEVLHVHQFPSLCFQNTLKPRSTVSIAAAPPPPGQPPTPSSRRRHRGATTTTTANQAGPKAPR